MSPATLHAAFVSFRALAATACLLILFALSGCGGDSDSAPAAEPVVREEFVQMASKSSCADLRNRLYIIDEKYVFWDKAGTCADASYAQTLFGTAPHIVLCYIDDSIAGPLSHCPNPDHAALMQTLTKNLDKADLGLGTTSRVQALTVPGGTPAALAFSAIIPRFFIGTPPPPVVIRDANAWKALISAFPAGQPVFPEPDFSHQMVLGVFSRTPNACNRTRIAGISSNGQQLTVEYLDLETATLQVCEPAGATPMSLALLDASPLPVQFVNVTASQLPFRTLAQSQLSAIRTPMSVVLNDAPSWSELWRQHLGVGDTAPQPAVDFASKKVAAIFLGGQPNGCHGIYEMVVWRSQGRIHVAHFDTIPGPTVLCTQSITSPAAMIEFDKSDEIVEFVAIPWPL